MRIKFQPARRDDRLVVVKSGDTLTINEVLFDFSPMLDGDTLPAVAIESHWFTHDIGRINGTLEIALMLPLPADYSPEQAFPMDLVDVPDGPVAIPRPLPDADGKYPELHEPLWPPATGTIDWTKLVTKTMKDAAALATALEAATTQLNTSTRLATAQVTALQGRVDAINDAIDGDYALPEEVEELPTLSAPLAAWKKYRVLLGRVSTQATWPTTPMWPVEPEPYNSETSSARLAASAV